MKASERGFSTVEAVVIVVVVGLIGGIGYVAYHRHQTKNTNARANTTQSQTVTAPAGTTENVDQLSAQDMNDETSIDKKYTTTYQSTASSTDQAVANVGGAYNESNF